MKIHHMKLHPAPFESIKISQKTIELRLYDEKREKIQAGDTIVFTNTATGETLNKTVAKLHIFDSFERLYQALPLLKCGYTQEDIATAQPSDMEAYYSVEEQQKYGVVGIELGGITMTEKEKMLAGLIYDANYDKELIQQRNDCKLLCQEYNRLPINDFDARKAHIKKIFGKTGEQIHIEPDFWCDYGYLISAGENFYANHGLVILDAGGVTFGDNVFIGPSCGFHTSGHPIDYVSRNQGLEYAYPITVGNNVWFGAGVQVLPGVTIGDNVVIGAGSVVVKDIPSNSVAVGNPCKVIRTI